MQQPESKSSLIGRSAKSLEISETSSSQSIMETVESIRSMEKQAEKIITDAHEQAEQTLKKTKENLAKMRAGAEETAVSLKNDRLHEGRASIEKEVELILKKAAQEGTTLKNSKLSEKEISDLLKSIFD